MSSAVEFVLPATADDLCDNVESSNTGAGAGAGAFRVIDRLSAESHSSEIADAIDTCEDRLSTEAEAIADNDVFDPLFSCASTFTDLPSHIDNGASLQRKVLHCCTNTVHALLQSTTNLFGQQGRNRQGLDSSIAVTSRARRHNKDDDDDDDDDDASDADSASSSSSSTGDNGNADDASTIHRLRNSLKMSLYLMSLIMTQCEEAYGKSTVGASTAISHEDKDLPAASTSRSRKTATSGVGFGGAKKKSKSSVSSDAFDWQSEKDALLLLLIDVFRNAHVASLWPMKIIEPSLIEQLFTSVMPMCAAVDSLKASSGRLKQSLCVLLSLMLKQHLDTLAPRVSNGFISLLMTSDQATLYSHFADFVKVAVDDYGVSAHRLTHEFVAVISRATQPGGALTSASATASSDSVAVRNVSAFLAELCTRPCTAEAALKQVAAIESMLECEAYQVRSGVVMALARLCEHAFVQREDDKEPKPSQSDDDGQPSVEKRIDGLTESQHSLRARLHATLVQRCHDVNAFTRSKTLQALSALLATRSIDAETYVSITRMAAQRLNDKSSAVRKSALSLLTESMALNPFAAQLDVAPMKARLASLASEFKDKMILQQQRLQQQQERAIQSAGKDMEPSSDDDDATAKDSKSSSSAASRASRRQSMRNELTQRSSGKSTLIDEARQAKALEAQQTQMSLLFLSIQYAELLQSSLELVVSSMMQSKLISDTVESIKFASACRRFSISGSHSAVKRALLLCWHREATVRDAVFETFEALYLHAQGLNIQDEEQLSPSLSAEASMRENHEVVRRLLSLTSDASLADLTSLEHILGRLVQQQTVRHEVVAVLIDVLQSPQSKSTVKQQALLLLTMLLSAQSTGADASTNAADVGLRASLAPLLSIGLNGALARCNPNLPRLTCCVLRRLTSLPSASHETIFEQLRLLLVETRMPPNDGTDRAAADWYSTAEEALNTLFALHSRPEVFVQNILQTMIAQTFDSSSGFGSDEIGNAERLSRLLFALGHVCIKLLVHLEALESIVKKLKTKQRHSAQEALNDADLVKRTKPTKAKKHKDTVDEEVKPAVATAPRTAIEDELAVNASEDYELEVLREAAERRLVDTSTRNGEMTGLLAVFSPIVLRVLTHPSMYRHARLHASAVLCLCKYMTASSACCASHLPLLFTLLRDSQSAAVRCNIMIALGDLSYRFPNLLEPWSARMFEALSDSSLLVRTNTLRVLTHLILNDQVKAKKTISRLCAMIIDPCTEIAALTRLFFAELATRGKNPIYNLLPDIMSRLSAATVYSTSSVNASSGDMSLTSAQFETIMTFLMQFIRVDKQIESLTERLCLRFGSLHVDTGAHVHNASDDVSAASDAFVDVQLQFIGKSTMIRVSITKNDRSISHLVQQDDADHQTTSNTVTDELHLTAQCRAMSFCLSQLPPSVASVKKLIHLFKHYEAKLGDAIIFEHLMSIVRSARKLTGAQATKADMKTLLDEFETRMQASHDKFVDEAAIMNRARGGKTKSKRASTRRQQDSEDDESQDEIEQVETQEQEESDDEKQEVEQSTRGRGRPAAAASQSRTSVTASRSSRNAASRSSSAAAYKAKPPAKAKAKPVAKKAAPKGRGRRRVASSFEDEESEEAAEEESQDEEESGWNE